MEKTLQSSFEQLFENALLDLINQTGLTPKTLPVAFKYAWVKNPDSSWHTDPKRVLDGSALNLLIEQRANLTEAAEKFAGTFFENFPEFRNKHFKLNNTSGPINLKNIFRSLLFTYFSNSFLMPSYTSVLRDLILETSSFFRTKRFKIVCFAPLLNFDADPAIDEIFLDSQTKIKKLSEEELLNFINNESFSFPMKPYGDFERMKYGVFVEYSKEMELFAEGEKGGADYVDFLGDLDRVLRVLRGFKSGVVGYDEAILKIKESIPLGLSGSQGWSGQVVIPYGKYKLAASEKEELVLYFSSLSGDSHRTFQVAISRLNESEKRENPFDKLLDAVVGLEAILLSSKGEDLRGELSYRFSLNYSSLFPAEERRAEFRRARKIYSMRSQVVHAGNIGKDKMPDFKSAADEAAEMLRFLIKRFLKSAADPEYLRLEYWESILFS